MTETISTRQLAAILGITVTRVNELGRKGKIRREPDGGWDLPKVTAALKQNLDRHQSSRALGQTSGRTHNSAPTEQHNEGESFAEAQRQNEWMKVQKAELELRIRKEELLERDQVKTEVSKMLAAFKNKMLYIPSRISQKLGSVSDDRERRAIIEREIKEALTVLSEYEPDAA
jgi:hypothetical protein